MELYVSFVEGHDEIQTSNILQLMQSSWILIECFSSTEP